MYIYPDWHIYYEHYDDAENFLVSSPSFST